MRRDRGMPATMVAYMPSKEYIANCKWFTPAECDVYGQEYATSGWTGALHNYRHRRTAFAANIAEQLTFSGRTIDVPTQFIAGIQAGAPIGSREARREPVRTATRKFRGVQLVDRAGLASRRAAGHREPPAARVPHIQLTQCYQLANACRIGSAWISSVKVVSVCFSSVVLSRLIW
jgi:hypothetical protein